MRAGEKEKRWYIHPATMLVPLLMLSLAAPILAAPGQRSRRAPAVRDADDVRETIQVLMIVSMKKALELTRDQEMEVIPRVQEMLDERERFAQRRRDALRRLQVKVMEEAVPEREFRESVLRLDELEKTHRDVEVRLRGEIDRSLNARQRAQLRLFVPHFRRQIQLRIEQARGMQERRFEVPTPPPVPDLDFSDDEF